MHLRYYDFILQEPSHVQKTQSTELLLNSIFLLSHDHQVWVLCIYMFEGVDIDVPFRAKHSISYCQHLDQLEISQIMVVQC